MMEQIKAPTAIESIKLPFKVKFMYALGDIAKSIVMIMTVGLSTYFYAEVCKLNPGITATLILVGKIWDIIFNPIMGTVVDRTRSKEGRCRMWLKYMSLPAAVAFLAMFAVPNLPGMAKVVYIFVTYLLQNMLCTSLIIPMNTLQGRLTSDPVERAQISQIRGPLNLIPNWFVPSFTIPLVMYFGQGNMSKGFLMVSIIYAVLYFLFVSAVYWGTRGYEPVEAPEEAAAAVGQVKQEKQPLGATFKALLKNPPWMLCIGMYMADIIFITISSQVKTWYYQYNIQSIPTMSLVNTIAIFAALPVYLFMSKLVKKFGNSGTAALGCIVCVVGYGMRFLLHDGTIPIILAGNAIHEFGGSLIGSTIVLCIFDSKVYGEWKTGVDNEALLMSGYSISYKIGQAIAAPMASALLVMVPYVAQAAVQEQSVLNLWFYESTLMPAVGFAIALFFAILLSGYEKKLPQMRAEIEARRSKV